MTDNIIKTGEVDVLRDLFTRFANTVTQASELAVQMADTRRELDKLTQDIESVRARNAMLDTELADVREARDKARRERDDFDTKLTTVGKEMADLQDRYDRRTKDFEEKADQVVKLIAERDDYGMKLLEQTERADKAEAILRDLRERLGLTPVELPPITTSAPVPETPGIAPFPATSGETLNEAEAPQGYVPFSDAPSAGSDGHSASAPEPKPERVYEPNPSDRTAADAFWGAAQPKEYDTSSSRWYYVKPTA